MLTAHSDKPKELLGLGTNSIAWISLKLSTVQRRPFFCPFFFVRRPLNPLAYYILVVSWYHACEALARI